MVFCPECETDLDIEEDEVDEGEVVSCPECGSDFEVITANPIELKPVDEEEYEEDEDEVKSRSAQPFFSLGLLPVLHPTKCPPASPQRRNPTR